MVMTENKKKNGKKIHRADDLLSQATDLAGHYRVPTGRSRDEAWSSLQKKILRTPVGINPTKRHHLSPRMYFAAASLLLRSESLPRSII